MLRVFALSSFLVLLSACGTDESQSPTKNQENANQAVQQEQPAQPKQGTENEGIAKQEQAEPQVQAISEEPVLEAVEAEQTMPVVETDQKSPTIGEMHWPGANSYCTFFKEGHKFDFDNKETWKFVFVTILDDSKDTAYMQINNKREKIKLVNATKSETNEKRVYEVAADKNIQIEVEMNSGKSGVEHTNYTGVIRLLKPMGGDAIKFYGDCGV
ncbi:hypothetical protein [Spartinivicinus ruber]|uniref:hypothetical protein n=1 Tax=Spartinivicinus ruber TaxID=2683272 RepID=UPI0013D1C740|nr:hypothetical protein [Spartinivicinus ruber]